MTVDDLRTRLTDEYGEERFTMTVSEIEQRAGRGSRRRLGAWAAVAATAAVAAVGYLVWQPPTGRAEPLTTPTAAPGESAAPSASPASTAWRAGFAAECERKWRAQDHSTMRPADRAQLPPLLIEQFHGELGIRVYASEWVVATCERTERETTVGTAHAGDNSLRWLPEEGTGISYFGRPGFTAASPESDPQPGPGELPGAYLIGRPPAGAVKVEAVLPDGKVLPAKLGGHLFLLWAPEESLNDAVVRADVNVSQVMAAGATQLPGHYDDDAMDAACRENLSTRFAAAGPIAMPPRRFVRRDGENVLFMYGSPDTAVVCARGADTISLTVLREVPTAPGGWLPAKHFHRTAGTQGWLLGLAPEGTTSGTLILRDGRRLPVNMDDGWYAASWTADPHDPNERPRRIELIVKGEKWTVPAAQ